MGRGRRTRRAFRKGVNEQLLISRRMNSVGLCVALA